MVDATEAGAPGLPATGVAAMRPAMSSKGTKESRPTSWGMARKRAAQGREARSRA